MITLVLLTVLALPPATWGWVWYTARQDDRTASDAIIVLGASQYNGVPSPVFEARLRQAQELVRLGEAHRAVDELLVRDEAHLPDGPAQPVADLGQRRLAVGGGHVAAELARPVVADERHETIGEPPRAGAYTPVRQYWWSRFSVFVRTNTAPAAMVTDVRAAVQAFDRRLPVFDVQPMSAVLQASYGTARFASSLTSAFAGLALFLAVAGVFAIASHGVARRTTEIGVRVALGATARDVRRAVVRPTLALVALGAAVGLGLAAAGATLAGRLLYNTSPFDPAAYATAAAVVVGAGFIAAWWPARRAGRIDPLSALRQS